MNQGETDLTKIRIPITILDGNGNLVTGYSPAAHELQTSKSGSALADAAGTLVEVSAGAYYYQGVTGDAATEGYIAVAINHATYRGFEWRPVIGTSGLLVFPFYITSGGLLATGCNPSGAGELQMSLDGAAFVAATGTFSELGLGYYSYLHNVDNVATPIIIKVNKSGYDVALAWSTSEQAIGGGGVAPTVTAVSPTPGVQPGAAGGFPADFFSAKSTPVVLQVTDTAGATDVRYVSIVVTFTLADGSKVVEPIYHRGNFVGLYSQLSYQVVVTNGIELHCARVGGWLGTTGVLPMQFDIDALDNSGDLT